MEFSTDIHQLVKKVIEKYGEDNFADMNPEAMAYYFHNPFSEELVSDQVGIRIKTDYLSKYQESLGEIWLDLVLPHSSILTLGGHANMDLFQEIRDYIVSLHPEK